MKYIGKVSFRVWGTDSWEVCGESPLMDSYEDAEDYCYENRCHYKEIIEIISIPECSTCNDTKEVENPLTGEMHFCPFCSDN